MYKFKTVQGPFLKPKNMMRTDIFSCVVLTKSSPCDSEPNGTIPDFPQSLPGLLSENRHHTKMEYF
jgi:hypothetical protein